MELGYLLRRSEGRQIPGFLPTHAALNDGKRIEPTLNAAIKEGHSSGGGQSDEFRYPEVSAEQIDLPADAALFHPPAQSWVEFIQVCVCTQPDAIGGIHDDDAGVRWGRDIKEVSLRECDVLFDTGLPDVLARNLNRSGIPIGGCDGGGALRQLVGR